MCTLLKIIGMTRVRILVKINFILNNNGMCYNKFEMKLSLYQFLVLILLIFLVTWLCVRCINKVCKVDKPEDVDLPTINNGECECNKEIYL